MAASEAHDTPSRRLRPGEVIVESLRTHRTKFVFGLLPDFNPASHVQAGSWGAMGYAVPGVIAGALACPDKKVVWVTGDGAFLMSSSDFITACQLQLPVVVAVHNDGHIGMIHNMQTRDIRRDYATELGEADYARYAERFGGIGIRVDDPADVRLAWDRALAADRPVLLDLVASYNFPWPSEPRVPAAVDQATLAE